MKTLTILLPSSLIALFLIFNVEGFYNSNLTHDNQVKNTHTTTPLTENLKNNNQLPLIKKSQKNEPPKNLNIRQLNTTNQPYMINGFDWSLPENTSEVKHGGLIGTTSHHPLTKNTYFIVKWDESNPEKDIYDFTSLERHLLSVDHSKNETTSVRLDVHSSCETPAWAMKQLRATKDKSLIFWDKNYKNLVGDFVREFAKRYASSPKLAGVYLGISDGEWNGPCDDLDAKDGWGEFWMSPKVLKEAKTDFGLTPTIFESSTKDIINIYTNAFGKYSYKLAYTNFGPNFSWDEGSEPYNKLMTKLGQYALDRGTGNRDGGAEVWMSYIDKIYGSTLTSMPDNTCRLEFDEEYAQKIKGRYWGTENEFYGKEKFITDLYGPYHTQNYRLLLNTLITLQMRRNFVSISVDSLDELDEPIYKAKDLITYLKKTIGKQIENTPDAFVVLGERYIKPELTKSHKNEKCVYENGDIAAIRSFGRWLVDEGESTPAIKTDLRDFWGQEFYLPDNIDYEYFAREAKQFSFNLNDQLSNMRCANGCASEIKVTFKDTIKTNLSVLVEEGKTSTITTTGDNKLKTVTFPVTSQFNNGLSGNDIMFQSNAGKIPVILMRVNFL